MEKEEEKEERNQRKNQLMKLSGMNKMNGLKQQVYEKDEKEYKFYRKASPIKSLFGNITYDLRFDSMRNSMLNGGVFSKMKAFWTFKVTDKSQGIPEDEAELEQKLPIKKPTFETHQNKMIYTWIGHSTAVISVGNDFNFIIDPVFADRCSPSQIIGPLRFRKPACQVHQIPINIHAVFVSHDHYDHLDSKALDDLQQKFHPIFFAGLQSQDAFPKNADLRLLDWTETQIIKINKNNKDVQVKVTFVPVCHWSRRGLNDNQKRLWGGFVIEVKNQKIFYSGDTGYCEVFKEIGQIHGPFELAILPIGAYKPRQILQSQHVNPQEAVKIHLDLRSKQSVGVHWGTFPLGNQHWCIAREDLQNAAQKYHLQKDSFITVQHGGQLQIDL